MYAAVGQKECYCSCKTTLLHKQNRVSVMLRCKDHGASKMGFSKISMFIFEKAENTYFIHTVNSVPH
jgi:hypothetical protein